MDRRAFSLGLALVAAAGFLSGEARAQENAQGKQDKFKVIASFSILADMAKTIGGDRAEVAALVGAGGDAHVYTPAPADARKVAAAGLVTLSMVIWATLSAGGSAITVALRRIRRIPREIS